MLRRYYYLKKDWVAEKQVADEYNLRLRYEKKKRKRESRQPTGVWEVVRTVAAPPSIVVKCGGWFFVWSFVNLFLSCRVLCCCEFLVVSCLVLFLLCVCVCGLFLFSQNREMRDATLLL